MFKEEAAAFGLKTLGVVAPEAEAVMVRTAQKLLEGLMPEASVAARQAVTEASERFFGKDVLKDGISVGQKMHIDFGAGHPVTKVLEAGQWKPADTAHIEESALRLSRILGMQKGEPVVANIGAGQKRLGWFMGTSAEGPQFHYQAFAGNQHLTETTVKGLWTKEMAMLDNMHVTSIPVPTWKLR